MPYDRVTIVGYNADPPTDDGAVSDANRITWAGIKEKLGDSLRSAIENVDSNLSSSFGQLDSKIASAENALVDLNNTLAATEGDLGAPSGTRQFFFQDSAPTLWTKVTTHNNKALRLVNGTVGDGGATSFTDVFSARTIILANLPPHTHSFSDSGTLSFNRTSWTFDGTETTTFTVSGGPQAATDMIETFTSISATIAFSGTSGGAGGGNPMDFDVEYVDIILAAKD